MDPKKKKMVWSNLREKTKLFNVKRSKDKPKKSNLRYRRSISVPNLMLDLLENGSLDVEHPSPDPDTIFFSVEPSDSEVSSLGYTEDVSAPSTPPLVRPSLSEAPALMERRPALTEVPVFREPKPVKSGAGKDRATTWYVTGADPPSLSVPDGKESGPLPVPAERRSSPAARTSVDGGSGGSEGTEKLVSALSRAHGGVDRLTPPARPRIPPDRLSLPTEMSDWNSTESMNSTPSEERTSVFWPSESDPALAVEPSSPVSNYMFITGSAENLLELVPNESNDYDASDLQAEKSNESQPAGGQKIQYLLTINLKEGRGLVARDRLGTSDPYVKFKLDSKTCYKSKVVNKTLNPTWNESFSFPVRDLEQNICVKVYDRDLRSHDFMGCSSFILNKLELDKTTEMVLRLEDPNSVEDNMGVIIIDACLSVRDGPTKRRWLLKRRGSINKGQPQSPPPAHRAQSNQKGQVWTGVYTILLVEGQDMPDCGQGDIYVRFRLGEQKFKSKNLCVKANPQWRETFDFNHFEDGLDLLQVEVCVKRGRKAEECWGMLDIDLSRGPVRQRQLYTRVLDPGKGRLVFLVTLTPCSGASISDLQSPPLDQPATFESMVEQYNILNSLKNMKDVGYLQVKLIKATDLLSTDLSGTASNEYLDRTADAARRFDPALIS